MARDFRSCPPIVVFQMGGVGSSTVYDSLLVAGLPNPVYHVHYLSKQGIREAEAFHQRLPDPAIPDELRLSESLRRKMHKDPKAKWFIITLMRDPVARIISSFFHNAWTHYQGIFNTRGQIDPRKALEALEGVFEGRGRENPGYVWFEHEFKSALGLDVRSLPVDSGEGYSLLEKGRFRVLAIRLEDLEQAFHPAVSRLLNLDQILSTPMVRTNLSRERDYYPAYLHVREHLKLSGNILETIYGDEYVRHFYTQDEITRFKETWS
ncbi:MAG: sulfotransferase family 2 domain-containing protein [Desulfatibacillum sp.]|nr:sulfotransferase family 2 domain-containing protein [Desulfatibacillum sp.]